MAAESRKKRFEFRNAGERIIAPMAEIDDYCEGPRPLALSGHHATMIADP